MGTHALLLHMTSQERFSVHSQLEHLQAKYVGTGHADTTKLCGSPNALVARSRACSNLLLLLLNSEWAVNQHRDSHALYVGFDSLSMFFAIAENEAIGRVKFNSLQVWLPLRYTPWPLPIHFLRPCPHSFVPPSHSAHPATRSLNPSTLHALPPFPRFCCVALAPENDTTVRATSTKRRRLVGVWPILWHWPRVGCSALERDLSATSRRGLCDFGV